MAASWKTFQISERAANLPASATLALAAKAGALRAEGKPVVNMTVGEPDFATPQNIVDAAFRAVAQGATHYTATAGTPALRQAVADLCSKCHGINLEPANVVVTPGGKFALFSACQALLNPGDEVLIPAPYWVSYPRAVELAGGVARSIPTRLDQHYLLTAKELEANLTDKVKLLILNSPSNPTGAGYGRKDLEELAEVLAAHPQVRVLWDDIYRRLVYDHFEYVSPATVSDLAERCLFLDGVSKTYAMTGWRIGWAIGPKEVIAAMTRIQGHATSNAAAVSQAAALEALTGPQDSVDHMLVEFTRRRSLIMESFSGIRGFRFLPPDGAFYLFCDVSDIVNEQGGTDVELADRILHEALVAAVPGTPFGAPGHLRFSFATSDENIKEATRRLKKMLGTASN